MSFFKRWLEERREKKEKERLEKENIIFRNRSVVGEMQRKNKRGYVAKKKESKREAADQPDSDELVYYGFGDFGSSGYSSDSCDSSSSSDSGSSGDCGGSD